MMRLLCRVIIWGFAGLYLLALLAFTVGYFGWFGAGKDALSGVYLVLLGLPWTRFVDMFPEQTWPVITALSPAVNLAILYVICRILNRQGR